MRYRRPKGDPAKTLAIILIGACMMLAIDLFFLGGREIIWPSTQHKELSENQVTELRDQHRRYLDRGVESPPLQEIQGKFMEEINVVSGPDAPAPDAPADEQNEKYASFPYEEFDEQGAPPPENIAPMAGVELTPTEAETFADPYFKTGINYDLESQNIEPSGQAPPVKPPAQEKAALLETHPPIAPAALPKSLPTKENASATRPESPSVPTITRGTVVIIIDDMGLTANTRTVENLPGPLTLAYLPYAQGLPEQTAHAKKNGHELMVHMPMEPLNSHVDGGPTLLKTSQDEKTFMKLLRYNLARFDGYVGVNNHMGSRLTQNRTAMNRVMKELRTRGLYFIDSKTIGSSVAAEAAAQEGLAYAERDIFLDHEITMPFIRAALKKVEATARQKGYAIAIGHPHNETIRALEEWLPTLKAKGLTLKPASAVVRHKPSSVVMAAFPVEQTAPVSSPTPREKTGTDVEQGDEQTTQSTPPEDQPASTAEELKTPAFVVTEQGIILLPRTSEPQAPRRE